MNQLKDLNNCIETKYSELKDSRTKNSTTLLISRILNSQGSCRNMDMNKKIKDLKYNKETQYSEFNKSS